MGSSWVWGIVLGTLLGFLLGGMLTNPAQSSLDLSRGAVQQSAVHRQPAGTLDGGLGEGALLDPLQALAALQQEDPHELFSRIGADLAPFKASGISERMVDQAYCNSRVQGFRFQVVGGRPLVVGAVKSFKWRLLNTQRQLYAVSRRWRLPDVDMMVEQHDLPTVTATSADCPERGPIIAPTRRDLDPNHTHAILAPDHTFGDWLDAGTLGWEETRAMLHTAAGDHPWVNRSSTLFFRGAPTGSTRPKLAASLPRLPPAAREAMDVGIVWGIHNEGDSNYKSLYEHCQHKHLLQLPGSTYSARLKYLMACGSAVLWLGEEGANLTSSWQEFWYHLLKAEQSLQFVEVRAGEDPGARLSAALQRLRSSDSLAQGLGRAGAELMESVLTPDRVQQYWYRLILQYAALQRFQPRRHPDAMPIEQAMMGKRVMEPEQRTCPRCRALA